MIRYEINISIDPKLTVSIKKSWFKCTTSQILDSLDVPTPIELGLVITNNKVIKQLNKKYRDKDNPTDVLAFYMLPQQGTNEASMFVVPPDGISHLGEIVISYPQAIYQAEEKKHDIRRELSILIIHGVLHLLGYDHEQPQEEQSMETKEKEILPKIIPHD